ncbi:MAG: hypothetical protein KatS3mg111_2363 [Pirellulaceae bacterium]|nr:MAG: hypothetical protein KatS3mg111_2363 [Pirellulaceae bacterium]
MNRAKGVLLSVIVPVFNEAPTIAVSLDRLVAALPAEAEVIVVDDGSTDGTRDIVRRWMSASGRADSARRAAQVTLLEHRKNRGKTAALRTGLAAARGEWVVVHDADLEYDPRDIGRLLDVASAVG